MATAAQNLDEFLKRVFSDEDRAQYYIKFGSPMDHDPQHGIKAGKLVLTR